MSESFLELETWPEGITAARIPANNNSRLLEALIGPAISATETTQPLGAQERDVYILPAGATGSNWSAFNEGDVVIFFDNTWTAYAPFQGQLKWVDDAGEFWLFESDSSGGWAPYVPGAGIPDAPSDGNTYGRKNGAWEIVAGSNKFVNIALSDEATDLTTGTNVAHWFAPEDGTLVSVFTGVNTQSSSGNVTTDMNDSGGTVFTTEPSIQASENTSLTGTPAVLDGTISFTKGDKFTFDITAAGTGARGLQACIEYAPA